MTSGGRLPYRQEFALAGYEFCISTLEDKIEREKELAEGVMSGRKPASLLHGPLV